MAEEVTRTRLTMKINRSSKIHFNKWLTNKKKSEVKQVLVEYARIVNWFIEKYEAEIPDKKKMNFLYATYIQSCISETGTWFTARMVKNCFAEGYGMVKSAKSNAENKKNKKYYRPVHYGKKMTLSETVITRGVAIQTKEFDYNLTLGCIGNKLKISIPLKKHKQFNKWDSRGKLSKSVTISEKYIMFTFEVETGKKKTVGNLIGVDFGLKKLCTISNGNIIGKDIKKHLLDLNNKKRCSKGYYRKKEEIKEYINKEIKDINFNDKQLVVVEKLKNMKYKMKERGRLSKSIRSVFYNLSYRQVLGRIQMLCEESRTSFRSVLPHNTSKECFCCGHIEKGNRLSQESFVCLKCGHSDNADLNASKVILKRFTTGTYGSCYKLNNAVECKDLAV